MMHLGSYDNESETFKIMESFCKENNLTRESKNIKKFIFQIQEKLNQKN